MITSNPWKQFKGLLPGGQRTIITITEVGTDGTSKGVLQNGDSIVVAGSSVAVGDKALVADGSIIRGLGTLTVGSLTLY